MKKRVWILAVMLLAVVLLALPHGAEAAQIVKSGTAGVLTWTLDDEGVLTISGEGPMPDSTSYCTWPDSEVRHVVIEEGVTWVNDDCFRFSDILTLTLPDAPLSLPYDPFEDNKYWLQTVIVGEEKYNYAKLFQCGATSFGILDTDGNLVVYGEGVADGSVYSVVDKIKHVVIRPGITGIGMRFLDDNRDVLSLTLPDTVTFLAERAFEECPNLATVRFSEGLTEIGDLAFYRCGIKELVFPDSLTTVGSSAFSYCGSLESLTGGKGLTAIGACAFYSCGSLKEVALGDRLTSLGEDAFAGCKSLEHVTIPESISELPRGAFYGCEKLQTVTLGESVTSIGGSAFANCFQLRSINLPESLTTIGSAAFEQCSNLTELSFPEGLVSIGDGAFDGCVGLESVTLQGKETELGAMAFARCAAMKTVRFLGETASIGSSAFLRCTALEQVQFPKKLTNLGEYAFENCSALTEIRLPEGITAIGKGAFRGCSALKLAVLPAGVESIEENAFYDCSDLQYVELGTGLKTVGKYAFYGCDALREIVLPEGVEEVAERAFCGAWLGKVVLPQSLTIFGREAFDYQGARTVYYKGTPEQYKSLDRNGSYLPVPIHYVDGDVIFTEDDGKELTVMAQGALPDYGMGKTYWHCLRETVELVILDEKITAIGDYAFPGFVNLKYIYIGAQVTDISDTAFLNCKALTIHGEEGSYAQSYAQKHGIAFTSEHSLSLSGYVGASCESQGYDAYQCRQCKAKIKQNFTPALGHREVTVEGKNPTCTREGLTEGKKCSRCNEVYAEQQAIPALGHSVVGSEGKAPTCTEPGTTGEGYCERCFEVFSGEEIPVDPNAHSYTSQVIPPADGKGAYTLYTCTACGHSYEGPAEHEGVIQNEKAATCTEPGYSGDLVCKYCGEVLQQGQALPVTEHVVELWVTVLEPSCSAMGLEGGECALCGKNILRNTEKTGHSFGLWIIDTESVLGGEEGTKHRECECGKTETATYTNPLVDVPNGKYFSKPIFWAYENGITKGKTATEFQRDVACTRKQIVTFLWRAAGCPEPASMENPFTDVKNDQFEKAILWAYYFGITKGTSATEFSPEKPCTRKQIVMFLWRFNECPEPKSMENPFEDVKRGDQFEKAILWALGEGITTGKTETTFQPDEPCTRGQIVTFLYRSMA